MFAASEVAEWITEPPEAGSGSVRAEGVTALCPKCGIDAVLPSAKVVLTLDLLEEMARHYFGGRFQASDS
jgi:hypothetical protein